MVLVTKYRRKAITPEVAETIDRVTRGVLERHHGVLAQVNGEADHRHFLLDLPPNIQPSVLVCSVKTATSRIVRHDFQQHVRQFYRKPVFWSRSYCLLTAGDAPLEVIRRYIENEGTDSEP